MAIQNLSKKSLWIGAISLALILFAAGLAYYLQGRSGHTLRPRLGPVVEAVYGLGTVVAPRTYQVKTAVNQQVIAVFVIEGDQVKSGDPLIQFGESGIVRAPFGGIVTSVPVKKGELVFPASPSLTLVSTKDLYLEVSLEQQAILRVEQGQKAVVSFESIRGDRIDAKVDSVFPRETQFIVRVSANLLPKGVLPGMTADVAIEVGRKGNVLSVPLRAISSGRITLKRNGKTIKTTIQVGVVDGEWAEVTSQNVYPDDEILVRPL